MKIKAFLAFLLLFCVLSPALAQTKPTVTTSPQQTTDEKDDVVKITTNLVQVDAVVTKNGKPVPNLTAEDFEIYEDGRRQAITSFAYISNVPNTASSPAPGRDKTDAVVPFSSLKRDDPRRTIALVVDDIGLSAESMSQVRRQLRKFVAEELQPNDLVAIIRTGGDMGALQQFTNDKRVLNRAVESLRWNICSRVGINVFPVAGSAESDPANICGGRSYDQTLKSLRFILDSMAELPGRKSMILLSDSMPAETQEEPKSVRVDGTIEEDWSHLPAGLRDSINYSSFLNKIAERAIRSTVVIYSVDTQGLAFTGVTAADNIRGTYQSVTAQTQGLMSARSLMLNARRAGGELLARQTGGFQVRNTNNFNLDEILEDQGGYYLIGYRPTEDTFNKQFHRIKAKVKRSGMSLRTRFGFYGIPEEEANRPLSARDTTNLALASPFSAQDIELELTSFFVNDKTAGSAVRSFVYIDAGSLALTPVDGRRQGAVDLHGVIFGDNGTVVQQFKRIATLNLSEKGYQHALSNGVGVTLDMPIKRAGAYQVRVAAKDRNSSRIGSAGQFVAVPDLDSKRVAVSGIVLGVAGNSGGDGESIAYPGTRRFEVNSDLYFTYMIYNTASDGGSQPRSLATEVRLFRNGKIVYSSSEKPIAVRQTDSNRSVASGVLRLTPDFEPGNYYLQVVMTEEGAKKKAMPVVQWVDFEIVRK
jgi:VWFA-related protein